MSILSIVFSLFSCFPHAPRASKCPIRFLAVFSVAIFFRLVLSLPAVTFLFHFAFSCYSFSSVSYYISRFQSFSVPAADADVHAADAAVAVDAVAVAVAAR